MIKAMDSENVVSDFELHMRYYVHFQTLEKGMNPHIPPSCSLNSTTTVLLEDGFCIK